MLQEELLASVKKAIRRTAARLQADHPGEALAGYALITDDGLETLSCTAVTEEVLAVSPEPDLLFCPTDWPYEPEPAAFESASQQLRTQGTGADLRSHVDGAFATLVQALAEIRAEGLFPPEVFLSVLSTDPSAYLESLEGSSVQRLNGPRLVEDRERFLEKWR